VSAAADALDGHRPRPAGGFMLQAVLFDLDGLLADSEPHSLEAWRTVLRRRGADLDTATRDTLFGQRLADTARLLKQKLSLPDAPEALAREKTDWQIANLAGRVGPMPGTHALLDALDARGVRKALATSGLRPYVDAVLETLGISGRFDASVTGEEVARGKPAPDVFLLAAQRVGVAPAHCLVLEDAPHGIAAAQAAGIPAFAIPNAQTRSLAFPPGTRFAASLPEIAARLDDLVRGA
jgi:HAD superfamily hydrolase (TIGR01509 family)